MVYYSPENDVSLSFFKKRILGLIIQEKKKDERLKTKNKQEQLFELLRLVVQ